ncbi:hypothetical protein KY284_036006, partial [Solanum tuberosum]
VEMINQDEVAIIINKSHRNHKSLSLYVKCVDTEVYTKDQCFKVKGYPVVWRYKKKGANSGSYANNVDVAQSAGMKASTSHNNIEANNMIPSSPAAFFTQDPYT